jgi:hypothetical protein
MTFRLACNTFAHESMVSSFLADNQILPSLTTGLTNGALSEDASIREMAASLAFNISLNLERLSMPHESFVELACALHHVLALEKSDETRKIYL